MLVAYARGKASSLRHMGDLAASFVKLELLLPVYKSFEDFRLQIRLQLSGKQRQAMATSGK